MTATLREEFDQLWLAYGKSGLNQRGDSQGYLRSLCRRVEFINMQRDILNSIDWNQYWNAGTYDHRVSRVFTAEMGLDNRNNEARLKMEVFCQEVAVTLIYKAFDDVISGRVNCMDTSGVF